MTRTQTETGGSSPEAKEENKNKKESEQGGAGAGAGAGAVFTLLLFAAASTYTGGQESLRLRAPTTLRQLLATLESRFPGFTDKVVRSAAITVNLEYVDFDPDSLLRTGGEKGDGEGGGGGEGEGKGEARDGLDLVIRPGDEVGILPPVSSG